MPIKTLDEFLKFNQLDRSTKSKIAEYQPSNLAFKIVGFYREMHFKHALLGKIPREWKTIVLNNYVDIETGKRPKGGARSSGGAISLGGEHIDENGRIIWGAPKFIPLEFYKQLSKGKVRQGDILLVKDGAKTGKVAFVDTLPHPYVAVNEHIFIIRSKNQNVLINKFLFYVLYSQIGQNQIKQKTHGIIGGIKRQELLSLQIPLPPLEEQWGIAEVLSMIDRAIEATEKLIEKLERVKKALMQELLTKGIGHREYKQTPIGKIPKEWKIAKLGALFTFKNGKRPSTVRESGQIPIYGAGFIQGYTDVFMVNKDNVIIIARVGKGSAGKVYIASGKMWISDNAIYATPKSDKVYPVFYYYLLQFLRLDKIAVRSAAGGYSLITQSSLNNLYVPLPSYKEQKQIADTLSSIDDWVKQEKKLKDKFERLKRGLMELLLTGRIRVRIERVSSG